MKRYLFAFILFCLATPKTLAQRKPAGNEGVSLSLHMLPVFTGCSRFEIEYGFDPKNSLSLSPVIYSYERMNYTGTAYNGGNPDENHRLEGYGFDLSYRYCYTSGDTLARYAAYVKAGLGFHNLTYRYDEYNWFAYTGSDGLEYYSYRMGPQTQHTRRFDISMLAGFKCYYSRHFYMDYYAGVVYKKAKLKSSTVYELDNRRLLSDQSYSGIVPRLGIALGYKIF